MRSELLRVRSGTSPAVVDLTGHCTDFLRECGADEGLLHVFVPHATAGVAIVETGAGSDDDLLAALDHLVDAATLTAASLRREVRMHGAG